MPSRGFPFSRPFFNFDFLPFFSICERTGTTLFIIPRKTAEERTNGDVKNPSFNFNLRRRRRSFFGEKWYLTKNITFLGWWHTVLNFHSCLEDSSLKNSPSWDSNYTTSNVTERSRVRIQGRQKLKIWIFARSENWFLNTVCGVEAFIF